MILRNSKYVLILLCVINLHSMTCAATQTCSPLPSYKANAVDHNIAAKYSSSISKDDYWKPLFNRSIDSPVGTHLSSEPLIGGILLEPPKGALPVDLKRFHRVLRDSSSDITKDELTVVTLGGSMTVGSMAHIDDIVNSNCMRDLFGNGTGGFDPLTKQFDWTCYEVNSRTGEPFWQENIACKPCAWPARLHRWLSGAYPHKKVKVVNLARGGLGTTAFVGMLTGLLEFKGLSKIVDVVIINFSTNDNAEVRIDLSATGKVVKEMEGVSDIERQRLSSLRVEDRKNKMRRDYEALLRLLLALPSKPAVLNLELGANHLPNGIYADHAEPLYYYQIPTLSWVQASKALVKHDQAMHPSWHWHQLVADYIAYTWTRIAKDECEHGELKSDPKSELPVAQWQEVETGFCLNDCLTFYDASSTAPLATADMIPTAVRVEGSWVFGNDRTGNGKMGWWIDTPEGGKIVFAVKVRLGSPSIGGLGFLLSWSKEMGAAAVSFLEDPPGRELLLDGFYDANGIQATISSYRRLCFDPTLTHYDLSVDGKVTKISREIPPPVSASSLPFILPDCDSISSKSSSNEIVTRHLQIHVLPRPDAKKVHNKFVIRYVSTC